MIKKSCVRLCLVPFLFIYVYTQTHTHTTVGASASVVDFPLVLLHTVCCSWFVISNSVKLLHLVSGLTLVNNYTDVSFF